MQDPRTNMKILSMMKELVLSSELFFCHGSGLESLLNALLPREKWLPIPSSFMLLKQGFSYTKPYYINCHLGYWCRLNCFHGVKHTTLSLFSFCSGVYSVASVSGEVFMECSCPRYPFVYSVISFTLLIRRHFCREIVSDHLINNSIGSPLCHSLTTALFPFTALTAKLCAVLSHSVISDSLWLRGL